MENLLKIIVVVLFLIIAVLLGKIYIINHIEKLIQEKPKQLLQEQKEKLQLKIEEFKENIPKVEPEVEPFEPQKKEPFKFFRPRYKFRDDENVNSIIPYMDENGKIFHGLRLSDNLIINQESGELIQIP